MRAAMAWIRLCRPMSIQVSEQEHFLLETDPYPAYSTTKVGQQERPHPQAGIAVSNDSKAIEQPNDPRRSVPFLHFSNQTFPGVDPNPAISPESGSNANKGRFPGTGVESQNFSLRNEHPTNQPGSLQPSQFVQNNQGTHTLRVNEYTNLQPQFINKSASAFASPRGDYKKDLFSANEQGPGDLAGKSAPYFHLKIVQDQVIKVDTPDPSPIPNLASSMVLEPPHDKTEIAKKNLDVVNTIRLLRSLSRLSRTSAKDKEMEAQRTIAIFSFPCQESRQQSQTLRSMKEQKFCQNRWQKKSTLLVPDLSL
jgi:hypothetical protein